MSTLESAKTNVLNAFQWEPQPAAERLVRELVDAFVSRNAFAKAFVDRLHREAGVRFVDMVDDVTAPATEPLRQRLAEAGFVRNPADRTVEWFTHPGGMFPAIVLANDSKTRVSMKVEFVDDFMAVWGIQPSKDL